MKIITHAFTLITTICISLNGQEVHPEKVKDTVQTIVYYQEGRFAGWPANNGGWSFNANELLVGFTEAPYVLMDGHNIGHPQKSWLAVSKDGGYNWTAWDPDNYVGDFGEQPELKELDKPLDFQKGKFAMRIVGTGYHGAADPRGHFFYSHDAGKNWKGPYKIGNFQHHPKLKRYWDEIEITSRTDYIVLDKHEALIFMSARPKNSSGKDRLFCIKSQDGGQSFQFMGWIVKPYKKGEVKEAVKVDLYKKPTNNPWSTQCRAVMSESFLLPNGKILSVMRRKYIPENGNSENWVDAYLSEDGGKTWTFQSMVGDGGDGNGNPPALALMKNGQLCAVFGERTNGTIQVAYSSDEGRSWTKPKVLYDNYWNEDNELNDLGYPRILPGPDDKMVAVFYYSTKEAQGQIHATIWEPSVCQ